MICDSKCIFLVALKRILQDKMLPFGLLWTTFTNIMKYLFLSVCTIAIQLFLSQVFKKIKLHMKRHEISVNEESKTVFVLKHSISMMS